MSHRVPTGFSIASAHPPLRAQGRQTAVSILALALGIAGCAGTRGTADGTGDGARGATQARATIEDDEEDARPVPPDPYNGVRYRGGRDPGTGVAPRLGGDSTGASVPPPRYRSVATLRSAKQSRDPASAPGSAAAAATAVARAGPPPTRAGSIDVQPGDTLYSIATRNGTSVAALMQANNLAGPIIKPGQKLVLPQ